METQIENLIVIKKINYEDFDEVVTVVGAGEKLSMMCKGVRKLESKNANALKLGSVINIEFFKSRFEGKMSKLKKAKLVWSPPLQILDSADVVFEIVSEVNRSQYVSRKFYDSYLSIMKLMDGDNNHKIKTFMLFQLLSSYGINPVLNHCVTCNRPDRINGFSFEGGGFTCALHTKHSVDLKYLKGMYDIFLGYSEYSKIDVTTNKLIYNDLKNYLRNFGSY